MALAQCPECEGNVSTSAHSCPHCGYLVAPPPFVARKSGISLTNIVAGVIGLPMLICFASSLFGLFGDSTGTRASAGGGAAVPPAQRKAIEITDVNYGVTEKNSSWWKYAYTVKIANNSDRPRTVNLKVKFLDSSGLVVDDDREYGVQIPARGTQTVAGYDLIRSPGAQTVTDCLAETR